MIVSHLLLILHKKIQFYIFMFEAWNVALFKSLVLHLVFVFSVYETFLRAVGPLHVLLSAIKVYVVYLFQASFNSLRKKGVNASRRVHFMTSQINRQTLHQKHYMEPSEQAITCCNQGHISRRTTAVLRGFQ